jgi:putative acetyltransferase
MLNRDVEIRAEQAIDAAGIRQVHLRAFDPSVKEAELVDLLRCQHQAVISLVAITKGDLVGHILFSPVSIIPTPVTIPRAVGLAPLAVLPAFQKSGIGSALVNQGIYACQQAGYDLLVVLGDPNYYTRFGFARAKTYGLENEYGADAAFMVLALQSDRLAQPQGLVRYCPEFQTVGC